MKKRLRRKKHLREFQELCFSLELKTECLDYKKSIEFIENITGLCEKYSLECGGGGEDSLFSFVISVKNYKVSLDRGKDLFLNDVKNIPFVEEITASDNYDAWYGDFV